MFQPNTDHLQVARKSFIELCAAYDMLVFKLRKINKKIKPICTMLYIKSVVKTYPLKYFVKIFCLLTDYLM
jgi:hypothetical protein